MCPACTTCTLFLFCPQVEVKNTQHYSFDRGHSVWRRLLLPYGDLQLSVLTRLTLSRSHKVRTAVQLQCTVPANRPCLLSALCGGVGIAQA